VANPLVSIIIPVFNADKYLIETIISAINQTWPNKEILIIDDGSTDRSYEIANSYQSDIVNVYQQKNSGAAAARNHGLAKAKGDYIQFLDADDLLSNDKIEKQVLALQQQPDKIAVCSTVHFPDKENHLLFRPSIFEENFIYNTDDPVDFMVKLWGGYDQHASMIQPNAWLTPIGLIKKVGKWNESLSLDDDGEYFARIILNSKGIIKVNGIFNYYRKQQNQNNLSSHNSLTHLNSQLVAALVKKKELFARSTSKEARQAIHRQLFELIVKSYPKHPSIYKNAMKELPSIDSKYYKPAIGGPKIQRIVDLFGWKTARVIQYIFK
jgi:glycosyltransferase involved in cell wall biosynthesis